MIIILTLLVVKTDLGKSDFLCFSSGYNKGRLDSESRVPTHLAADSADMASGSLVPQPWKMPFLSSSPGVSLG